ncbi:Mevalonate kinase [Acromyrmex echinatior]|uniref:Mevalonate kinase n=1 Tax=Acromyrmex echinatior TaxID=103372 RepID=F4WXC6_ACREC|nr:Mevalonate kinase [Acromyrmex echinatior]
MYRFTVSAPGTVILCGERKQTCVAASLDMRTVLKFSSFPTNVVRQDFMEIKISSIGLRMKIPLRIFLLHFYGINYCEALDDFKLFESVKSFTTFLSGFSGNYDPNNHAHRLSVQAFIFLLVLISYKNGIVIKSSFVVDVISELAFGEDLGCSASFVVCLAACFWRWYLLQQGTVRYIFNAEDFSYIMKYAYSCEQIVYNSCNLINIAISTGGKIRVFKGALEMANIFFGERSMKILLVFSNIIETSMKIKECLSSIADFILHTLEILSNKFIETLKRIDDVIDLQQRNVNVESNSDCLINYYNDLVNLININEGLLRALGTSPSSPVLDIICAYAKNYSLGGKIATSGSRYAFILLLPNTSDELIQHLMGIFESHGFLAKITSLNCSGVRIQY